MTGFEPNHGPLVSEATALPTEPQPQALILYLDSQEGIAVY